MATTETASKEHYKAFEDDTVPATFQFTAKPVPDRPALSALEHVIVIDEGDDPYADADPDSFDFDAAWQAVEPDDILTLIYTSGTTGNPKGVQISHRNILETVRSYAQIVDFPDGGQIVSYLPMAHVAERNVSHYLPMAFGFTVTCLDNPRELAQALPQVHPTWFFA